MLVWGRTGKAWRLGARDNRDLFSEVPRRVPCTSPPHVWALYGLRGDAFVPPARVEVLGTRPRQKLLLCARPKSARDCERISKLPVEKRLTNANSDAPPEVHQLSVATCHSWCEDALCIHAAHWRSTSQKQCDQPLGIWQLQQGPPPAAALAIHTSAKPARLDLGRRRDLRG